MKVYLGRKPVDVKEVGSVVIELDEFDKDQIRSMSPRETLYGMSLASKDSDKTLCAVLHGKLAIVENPWEEILKTVPVECMTGLLARCILIRNWNTL